MKATTATVLLHCAFCCVCLGAKRSSRPNVVFFLVDDLGWRDVGFNGCTFYETPNIDGLAESGAVFRNAYAACPVCSPTRASIITGRHPVRVGITDWLKGMNEENIRDRRLSTPEDRNELALEEITFVEHLKHHGYQTFFVGKWHLGGPGFSPEEQGFDINIGGIAKGSPPGGYYAPFENPKLPDLPNDFYLTDRLTDESVRLLRERDTRKPFVLFLSYYNVHTPIQANRELVARFKVKATSFNGRTPYEKEHTAVTRVRQDNPAFASMVAAMDNSVGRVLSEIDELRLTDDTVIIFFSDNGGLSTHVNGGPTSNLPLRAGKGWLYEGGIRVPMIVRAPGVTQARSVFNSPVISMDFFPTVLELVGLPLQPDLHCDGTSIVPMMRGESTGRRELYWHYPHYHGSQWMPGASIRDGDWKLIEHYHWQKVELFNLADDPGEEHDLSKVHPDRKSELLNKLHAWQKTLGARMPFPNQEKQPSNAVGYRVFP